MRSHAHGFAALCCHVEDSQPGGIRESLSLAVIRSAVAVSRDCHGENSIHCGRLNDLVFSVVVMPQAYIHVCRYDRLMCHR